MPVTGSCWKSAGYKKSFRETFFQPAEVGLDKAFEGVPEDGFKFLLAHSPEICRKAAFAGTDLYLCGHTHAGQICLPGGHPLLINSKCPRECHSGLWEFEGMTGYTSHGAGASSVAVRFNCPPEITIHTLRRKTA